MLTPISDPMRTKAGGKFTHQIRYNNKPAISSRHSVPYTYFRTYPALRRAWCIYIPCDARNLTPISDPMHIQKRGGKFWIVKLTSRLCTHWVENKGNKHLCIYTVTVRERGCFSPRRQTSVFASTLTPIELLSSSTSKDQLLPILLRRLLHTSHSTTQPLRHIFLSATQAFLPVSHSATQTFLHVSHSATQTFLLPVGHSATQAFRPVSHSATQAFLPVSHSATQTFLPVTQPLNHSGFCSCQPLSLEWLSG